MDEEASLNEVRNEPIATESQVSVSNEETIKIETHKCGQCERPFKHGDYVCVEEDHLSNVFRHRQGVQGGRQFFGIGKVP